MGVFDQDRFVRDFWSQFDVRYERKRQVDFSALVESVERNGDHQITGVTAKVQGLSGVRVQGISPTATSLAAGQVIAVENVGGIAAPAWAIRGSPLGGALGVPRVVEFNEPSGTYGGGDLLLGSDAPTMPNFFFDESTGEFLGRIGTGATLGLLAASSAVFVGDRTGPHTYIDASGLALKYNGTVKALDATSANGLRMYDTGGNQRVQIATNGSGWLVGSNRIWWDTSGNLSVSGALTAGSGSVISGDYITAGTITGNQISASSLIQVGSAAPYINIDGTNKRIDTSNFATGVTGFRMDAAGNAEFNNITARGAISASVFEKKVMTAVAGGIVIAKSAGKLSANYAVGGTMTIESPPDNSWAFATNDIIRIKGEYASGTGDTWVRVTRTGTTNQYTSAYLSGTNSITYPAGTSTVDYGQTGQGIVIITADETADAPYIDIATHAGSPWSAMTLKARLGNLTGVGGASGYGLWSDNVFLTGSMTVTGGNALVTGGAAADVNSGATTITGGKITSGSVTATQLSAAAIDGMTITGSTVRTAASGARVEMNTAEIFGTDGAVTQWSARTSDGKLLAGAGSVVLDNAGIHIDGLGQGLRLEASGVESGRLFLNSRNGATSVVLAKGSFDSAELLTNTNFETDLTGWTDASSNGVMARTTSEKHGGSASMAITQTADYLAPDGRFVSAKLSITGGDSVVLGAWYKLGALLANSYFSLVARWYTSGDAYIHEDTAPLSSVVSGKWEYANRVLTAPATAAKVEVGILAYCYGSSGSSVLYVDDISAKRTTADVAQIELSDAALTNEIGNGSFKIQKRGVDVLTVDGAGTISKGGTATTQFVPLTTALTSTSYDGNDTVATGTTSVDTSVVFAVPAGARAVLAQVQATWAAANSASQLALRPKGGSVNAVILRAHDTVHQDTMAICPCDTNGDIDIVVANANATNVVLRVWGYWI